MIHILPPSHKKSQCTTLELLLTGTLHLWYSYEFNFRRMD